MARIRKFCAYRRLERPYTRVSKYRNKSYVRAKPVSKIVRYHMGDHSKEFPVKMTLVSKDELNIRHNALESARLVLNRALESGAGKENFYLVLNVYPHHILRENPLASGAGADRMSTGMKKSFGKSIGRAARIKRGQAIFTLSVSKTHAALARKALKRAYTKLPGSCFVVAE